MKDERFPKHVYFWQNGMVMTFDQYGQQMPEFQGTAEEVGDKVRAAARPETVIEGGNWNTKTTWPMSTLGQD